MQFILHFYGKIFIEHVIRRSCFPYYYWPRTHILCKCKYYVGLRALIILKDKKPCRLTEEKNAQHYLCSTQKQFWEQWPSTVLECFFTYETPHAVAQFGISENFCQTNFNFCWAGQLSLDYINLIILIYTQVNLTLYANLLFIHDMNGIWTLNFVDNINIFRKTVCMIAPAKIVPKIIQSTKVLWWMDHNGPVL